MKLYEIDKAIQEIIDGMTVDEETGEVLLDQEALEALQMQREQKLEGAALVVKNLEAEAAAIEAEEKKLAARKTAAKNRAKRIREWIAYNIGTGKLSTPRVSISVRPGVQSAVIDDVEAVVNWSDDMSLKLGWDSPETWQIREKLDAKMTYTVSKAGLKKLLAAYDIPGAHIEDGKPILTIR